MKPPPKDKQVSWTQYVWLVYLLLWIVPAWTAATPPWIRPATAAGVVAFIALYVWIHRLDGRRKLRAIGGMTALGCLFLPWSPGASVLFIYAATFVGEVAAPRIAYRYLAGLVALLAAESWAVQADMEHSAPAIVLSALLGAVTIHRAEQWRSNRRLECAQEEVAHLAKIAERERIARDLHDLLGHTLSVIVLKSELASKLADTDLAGAVAEIRDVESISRKALAEVRMAVSGYRSAALKGEVEHLRQTLATAGLVVDCEIGQVELTREQEAVLALALREAVTNVIRHARASCCRIRLAPAGLGCELEVSDDGAGADARDGSGLSGMRERVEALGGSVEVQRGAGTTLRIRLNGTAAVVRPA